jgi:hypothetical protein
VGPAGAGRTRCGTGTLATDPRILIIVAASDFSLALTRGGGILAARAALTGAPPNGPLRSGPPAQRSYGCTSAIAISSAR